MGFPKPLDLNTGNPQTLGAYCVEACWFEVESRKNPNP